MKFVVASLAETADLVKESKTVFLLYVFFGTLPLIGSLRFIPSVISLSLAFISLGWFAWRFFYLDKLYKKKQIQVKWYSLLENVIRYALKLLPLLLLFLLSLVLPLVLMTIWYGRWFALSYLNQGSGLTTQEVMQRLIPALFNVTLWQEFITQNPFTMILGQTFQLLVIIGLLALKLSMIFLVIEKLSIWESFQRGFYYLSAHVSLITSFLVLRISGNILAALFKWLVQHTVGYLSLALANLLLVLFISGLTLVLDIYIFSYYSKSDSRSFLSRKLGRWWRSR